MSCDKTVARVPRGNNLNPTNPRTSGETTQGTAPTGQEERRGETKDEEPPTEGGDDLFEETEDKHGDELVMKRKVAITRNMDQLSEDFWTMRRVKEKKS
jgi:hypothetical protein